MDCPFCGSDAVYPRDTGEPLAARVGMAISGGVGLLLALSGREEDLTRLVLPEHSWMEEAGGTRKVLMFSILGALALCRVGQSLGKSADQVWLKSFYCPDCHATFHQPLCR